MTEKNIDKLLNILDISFIASIGCSLLYILGYVYYQEYYGYFGINLAVRDPQLYEILRQGAYQIPFVFLIIILTVIVYFSIEHILVSVQQRVTALAGLKTKLVALTIASALFFIGFDYLISSVINIAKTRAAIQIKESYHSVQNDFIYLQNNNITNGKCRFFFLNKNHIVFLKFIEGDSSKVQSLIFPSSDFKQIIIERNLTKVNDAAWMWW